MFPFIAINDGKLTCTRGVKFSRKATAANAQALGRKLKAAGLSEWLYSSSVDFPTDDGGPDLDFRSLIETAFHQES